VSYEQFLKDKFIKKQNPDFKKIEYQLKRAQEDIKQEIIKEVAS
jgi:hypothetical protein